MTKPSPRMGHVRCDDGRRALGRQRLAQPAQPAQSMEERLRAQLRNTTAQLQQAQNELAALKAGQSGPAGASAGKDSPDALRKALEAAQAQLATEKQARERWSRVRARRSRRPRPSPTRPMPRSRSTAMPMRSC